MPKVLIINGKQGQGKTIACQQLSKKMIKQGLKIGGFIAPGKWRNKERFSFELLDLQSHNKYDFASRTAKEGWEKIHSFYFNPKAITIGEELLRSHSRTCDWLFIDEIGKFDIKEKVWGPILHELLKKDINLVLCIRDIFVDDVIEHFGIKGFEILNIENGV